MTNAVQFWSKYHVLLKKKSSRQQRTSNTAIVRGFESSSSSSNECFAATATVPQQQQHNHHHHSTDCCHDCQSYMSVDTVSELCRGGHSSTPSPRVLIDSTPYNIPLTYWKILMQIFLTAMNVACWYLPLKSKKMADNKLALSLANAFSGGVFLSLAFGHLLPECIHGFDGVVTNEAVPFLLVLTGYLVIFFVEKVAFDAHDILHEMSGDHHCSHDHSSKSDNQKKHAKVTTSTTTSTSSKPVVSGRSAIILLGALAVHSILEMMALGLADTFGDCALLTMSISLHQPAESIALLVAFLKSGLSDNDILRYLSIFSCMGPIGVGLGILVNHYAPPIVDSAMLAVVAGTFIYVGATEVIPEEWETPEHKWKKFVSLMTGILSILAITQYTMSLGGGHVH